MRARAALISSFVAVAAFAGVLVGWRGGIAAPNRHMGTSNNEALAA